MGEVTPDEPPTVCRHYCIVSKLGDGGMDAVYCAADTQLNHDVPIKVPPEAFAADAVHMARFEGEVRVLASLNHPNIATTHNIEEDAISCTNCQADKHHGLILQGRNVECFI